MQFLNFGLIKEYVSGSTSSAISKILKATLSEKMIMTVVLGLLEKLVASTDNKLDDKVLKIIKKEMKKKGYISED